MAGGSKRDTRRDRDEDRDEGEEEAGQRGPRSGHGGEGVRDDEQQPWAVEVEEGDRRGHGDGFGSGLGRAGVHGDRDVEGRCVGKERCGPAPHAGAPTDQSDGVGLRGPGEGRPL